MGRSGRARLSKTGAPQLRKALYFPAVVAIRHNPYVKELRERLKERGKCPMQVIGAAMRKLVHLAYGVLKTGRPFDPEWSQKQKQLDSQHSISPARKDCERHPISRMTSNVIRVGCRPLLYVVGFEG